LNLGVAISEDQLARLETYADLLLTWNQRVRLIGDKDPGMLFRKHIPDCLGLLSFLPIEGPVADIGSGAGLPGLVLACMRPDLDLWLIESRGRRVSFLHDATARIGLGRVRILGFRAEELASRSEFAKAASLVTGRAVAIEDLLSHGLPLLHATGRMALMQSQKMPVEGLQPVVSRYGMKVAEVHEYRLIGGEGRRIVVLGRA
jgi:16S rRNA (guanine527-N7)-methyltransferase